VSYSIIRMQKMKAPAIRGMQFHNQRERESETNPDIDKEKTGLNYDLVNTGSIDYVETIKNRIDEGVDSNKKIRKDAVRLCEFLITSDKEFFANLSEGEEKKFFESGLKFLKERYGSENIIYGAVHKDERTPHMHVGLIPITEDKKLSAKTLFGKLDLVKLQDDFHKHMNEAGFNLERGISSNREHLDTAKYKAVTMDQKVKELEQKVTELESRAKSRESLLRSQQFDLAQNKKAIEETNTDLDQKKSELNELKENIEKIEAPLKQLEEVQPKKSSWSDKVSMTKEEYEVVESWAKKGMLQTKNTTALEKENTHLKQENQKLSEQRDHFKSMFDKYFKKASDLAKENTKLIKENKLFKMLYQYAKKIIENLKIPELTNHLVQKEKETVKELKNERQNELERD
jgi:DNA repair exonuclease SbcCD ATPase subunit